MNIDKKKIAYDISISILALMSVTIVILDLIGIISLSVQPYRTIDITILVIFWIDYLVGLYMSKKKNIFIKNNIINLLAIVPFNEVFSLFRIARIFRLTRLTRLVKVTRLTRLVGFLGIAKKKFDKFFKTNGFIYMIYLSCALLLFSSFFISFVEDKSFLDSLWWSIVTATTVGYGDISPSTGIGRIMAVILMLFGIGFIGMLTGTITTFFATKIENDKRDGDEELHNMMKDMSREQIEQLVTIAKSIKHDGITVNLNISSKEKG